MRSQPAFNLLLQELQDALLGLVGLRQSGNAGLVQNLELSQIGDFL